ncbi:unnamed protein product [Cuscuta epithymum]|uniref:Uncharacterized protein n=1 Tax=Cuscuta epithymum TaxID=186058 RepID=A0AAV0E5B8_9ASTE|nr:unnamed protein product [Cuscuta epithymum]CAH9117314.1 unnamed protein product [Cuscuta epithymum]
MMDWIQIMVVPIRLEIWARFIVPIWIVILVEATPCYCSSVLGSAYRTSYGMRELILIAATCAEMGRIPATAEMISIDVAVRIPALMPEIHLGVRTWSDF